jgi:hypothetical protein
VAPLFARDVELVYEGPAPTLIESVKEVLAAFVLVGRNRA